jgi:hypothetical protein
MLALTDINTSGRFIVTLWCIRVVLMVDGCLNVDNLAGELPAYGLHCAQASDICGACSDCMWSADRASNVTRNITLAASYPSRDV